MSTDSTVTRRNALKGIGGALGTALVGGLGATALSGGVGAATEASFTIDGDTLTTDDGELAKLTVHIPDYTVSWDGFDEPVYAVAYRDTVVFDPGSEHVAHTLYDGVNAQNGMPVLADSNDNGKSDFTEWGGQGEYAESLGLGTQHERQHGTLHADITWHAAVDPAHVDSVALSVENPWTGLSQDDSVLEEARGGQTDPSTVAYTKEVLFFAADKNGGHTANDGTTVALMGAGDTKQSAKATASFTVTVGNQASTTGASGSGSSSLG